MTAIYLLHRSAFVAMLDPRLYTPEWLDHQVNTDQFRVFGNHDACVLVSVKLYPTGVTEIHGEAAVGRLEAVKALIDEAIAWARSIGCTIATIASREGWVRALKHDGWDTHQVTIRKEI